MRDGKQVHCLLEGLCRRGVPSDVGGAHVRAGTSVVPGEGNVKNHCMSRGQERNSPASAFSFVSPWVQGRGPGVS